MKPQVKQRLENDQRLDRLRPRPSARQPAEVKGILDQRWLPDREFNAAWDAIIVDRAIKDRLLSYAILDFTVRAKIDRSRLPVHGILFLAGPPGTGKTTLARGLASRIAECLPNLGRFRFLEVEPHGLASSSLGKSQQAVTRLLGGVIAEHAATSPLIVLLDEVETLAADRRQLSFEANPADVHRTTDAVLAQLDHLAATHHHLLFIATSNFPEAIDAAFLSRVDLVETIGMPSAAACREILWDTVSHLIETFGVSKEILSDPALERAAAEAIGLDGRAIRKCVFAACAYSKETALEPRRVSATHVLEAVMHAKRPQRDQGAA